VQRNDVRTFCSKASGDSVSNSAQTRHCSTVAGSLNYMSQPQSRDRKIRRFVP